MGLTAAWHAFLSYLCWPSFPTTRLGTSSRARVTTAGLLRGLLLTYWVRTGPSVDAEVCPSRLEPDILGWEVVRYRCSARRCAAAFDRAYWHCLDSPAQKANGGFISSEEELEDTESASGNTEDTDQIKRVLELSISPRVRQQDTPSVICSLCACGGLKARRLAWQFVKSRWPVLRATRASSCSNASSWACARRLCSAEDAEDLRQFFATNSAPSAARAVKQALETVQLRARLLSQDGHTHCSVPGRTQGRGQGRLQ
uniref:ERAP1_C domain-containing protein n=1 Tax=Macrostomum lignano TaxID=282301 RepID=A0A1I8FLW5_9PLAT